MNIPGIKHIVLMKIIPYPNSLIPSADHRGVNMLTRNPEVNVPSSLSAPSPRTINAKGIS
jgi:hypothetical protein